MSSWHEGQLRQTYSIALDLYECKQAQYNTEILKMLILIDVPFKSPLSFASPVSWYPAIRTSVDSLFKDDGEVLFLERSCRLSK